ncbi:MAG: nickel-dependent lactate racemase [Bacillota bacterium]|nr:nickel-dependent lactate racemase [Bacillota bacterium]MDW7670167.1 nickel-dependent lactate racemase [Bacillota bacterium]
MTKYQIKYGKTLQEITLPEDEVIKVLNPNQYEPKFTNAEEIILEALNNPIGTPTIKTLCKPGEKVCLMVNDITRLTKSEVFVPIIVNQLNQAGIKDKDITILFANGLHKPMNKSEMQTIIGEELFQRIHTVQHDGVHADFVCVGQTSSGNKVYINKLVTEVDKVIITGGIIMHHLAGYGGGRKNIIPGCAKKETIFFNHRMMVDPKATAGNTDGNPIHIDLVEACEFVNPDFLFNVILDHDGKIADAVAGHWKTAHEAGCAIADLLYKVHISKQSDMVIASGGGFPKDIDLRQSKKGYYHAVRAVKPGGIIIAVVACTEGISREGDPFELWLEKYKTLEEIREALLANFDIGGLNAYRTREVQAQARLILITDLDAMRLGKLGIQAYGIDQLQQIIDQARSEFSDKPTIYIMPQAGLTLPSLS